MSVRTVCLNKARPSVKVPYPTELFDLVTDILADLVLEDMKIYPQLRNRPIDSFAGQENTASHLPIGQR